MPYSTTQITNYIAMAQRAYADYMLKAAKLEDAGDEPTEYYIMARYLSAATRVLQYTDHDLTADEVEGIIHCMIETGKINDYSGATLTFPTITVVYPTALTAKLSTLTDGPGGGTGTLVGSEMRVPAVNSAGTAWEYKKAGFQGTVIYVSPSGTSGQSEKGNIIYHYPTITLAQTAAVTGDTIVVMPGTYSDTGLGVDGVTYHFEPGAVLTTSGSANIFTISSAITVKVTGWGLFNMNSATANAVAFKTNHASAVLYVECLDVVCTSASRAVSNRGGKLIFKGRKVTANSSVSVIDFGTATADLTMELSDGAYNTSSGNVLSILGAAAGCKLKFKGDIYATSGKGINIDATSTDGKGFTYGRVYSASSNAIKILGVFPLHHSGTMEADAAAVIECTGNNNAKFRGDIICNWANASGHGLLISGTAAVLEDCTILITHASAYPVHSGSSGEVVVYNARTNSMNKSANISYLANNILTDPDNIF